MTDRTTARMLAPVARRLQNLLARGTVALSNAGAKMQALQVRLLADETLDGIEHFEPYGFTSRPLAGAEVLTLSVDGDRSHTVVIVAADRRYRMQAFEEGEVALFDDQGQSVHLKRTGIVVKGAGLPMLFEDTPSITFKASAFVRFETPVVQATQLLQPQQLTVGGVSGGVGAAVATMNGGTVNFNAVTHNDQNCAVTYVGTVIRSDGRRIDGTHVHPETGGTTIIPNA